MSRKPSPNLANLVRRHKAALDRVIDRQAILPMSREFSLGLGELSRALGRAARHRGMDLVTGASAYELTNVARAHLALMFQGLGLEFMDATQGTLTEGVRSLAQFTGQLSGLPSVLDEQRTVLSLVANRRNEIEMRRKAAIANVAVTTAQAVSAAVLAAVVEPVKVKTVVQTAVDAVEQQWWQVERTARTETSHDFNQAQAQAIRELPGTMKRWTELVSDVTGEPLDSKVAKDSLVMHGQIVAQGALFTMPPDPRAPVRMVGQQWDHPPNRPNDRGVIIPWRKEWGIPGWMLRDGRRVEV